MTNSSTNEEFVVTSGGESGVFVFNLSFVHETVKPGDNKRSELIKSKILLFFIDKYF